MKIAIAGGGTGGHLFPALAVAEVYHERGDDVMIFVSEKEIDSLATRDRREFRIEKLPTIGMPRIFSPRIFSFLKRFNQSLRPCRALYRDFQPNAVLAMGGFTSTAPILAAKLRRLPAFLHESNAIPGKANRLNAKMSDAVLLGFAECARYFPKSRCEHTGTPIRRTLMQRVPKEKALATFGLESGRSTLLVMGGSQGAHGINTALIDALPLLRNLPIQFIHLTGAQDEQFVRGSYQSNAVPAHVAAFHHQMQEAYNAADLALSRAGAASLSELAHFGLPSILIPYPHAAEDHQARNAAIFERAGAAKILKQENVSAEKLAQLIRSLCGDNESLREMAECSGKLAPNDAARQVVEVIDEFFEHGQRANPR
jgi:UDP-N-acetylglucosamine--N-acetylmuramyl-(pentapeptide) pyrophosphoryl-undecaprenol N-acetylglucosamine transferase